MKRTLEELLSIVREHGGEEPDDFTIGMLEDISDSFVAAEPVDNTAMEEELNAVKGERDQAIQSYNELKKAYADRFVISDGDKEDEPTEETIAETYDSIFD